MIHIQRIKSKDVAMFARRWAGRDIIGVAGGVWQLITDGFILTDA